MFITRLFILHLISLTLLNTANALRVSKFKCDKEKFDICSADFLHIVNGSLRMPENDEAMNKSCTVDLANNDKCIRDYFNKCLSTFVAYWMSILRFSVKNQYQAMCTSKVNNDAIYSLAKCYNSQKQLIMDNCYASYADRISQVKYVKDSKSKLGFGCCYYWRFIDCSAKIIREGRAKGDSNCDDNLGVFEFISLAKNSGEWRGICGAEYADTSDKCRDLVEQNITRQSESFRWRSPLLYYIEMLESI